MESRLTETVEVAHWNAASIMSVKLAIRDQLPLVGRSVVLVSSKIGS